MDIKPWIEAVRLHPDIESEPHQWQRIPLSLAPSYQKILMSHLHIKMPILSFGNDRNKLSINLSDRKPQELHEINLPKICQSPNQ